MPYVLQDPICVFKRTTLCIKRANGSRYRRLEGRGLAPETGKRKATQKPKNAVRTPKSAARCVGQFFVRARVSRARLMASAARRG
jgi:hypothetical protein